MKLDDKIYIAGHLGLIGSSLVRRLTQLGHTNILTTSRSELDLTDQAAVKSFFAREKPDYVFFAAARTGGVFANNNYRAEFIYENLVMQNNVVHYSFLNEVKKLIFFACADIYPLNCPRPTKEDYLLTGALEATSEPFSVAKIAGVKMCEAYRTQYGMDCVVVVPSSVYGPNQHYDALNSQVIPALIEKIHEANLLQLSQLHIWGSGLPERDFIFVDDLSDACILLMSSNVNEGIFNIGSGQACSISQLAKIVQKTIGYTGKIIFDKSKPEGAAKKLLDIMRIQQLNWQPQVNLKMGIVSAYKTFLDEIKKREIRTSRIERIFVHKKDKHVLDNICADQRKVDLQQPENYKNKVVLKPWGYEHLIFENAQVAVWLLYLKYGHSTSMHSHPKKKTSLLILTGRVMSNTLLRRQYLQGGDALILEKGVFHSTKALSEKGVFLLEIETPPDKLDLVRLKDCYGRENEGYEGVSEMVTSHLDRYQHFHFDSQQHPEKFTHKTDRFVIDFEVFNQPKEFLTKFKPRCGELYTSCQGDVIDQAGQVVLPVGDTQKSEKFLGLQSVNIQDPLVLMRTVTLDEI